MRRGGGVAGAFATLALAACATTPPPPIAPPPRPAPPVQRPPEAPPPISYELSALPGWAQEDHAAAFAAYRATCQVSRDPGYAALCQKAQALGSLDEISARHFFETSFRAAPSGPDGLLTGYFAPEYEARFSRQDEFTAVVRPKPADLAIQGADRATIEATPEERPLAWMRPEDLYFLQVQGSGKLRLPDGQRIRVLYDGNNGQPYVPIAAPMREQGLLGSDTSAQAIRQWLADHRGPEADAVMDLNPRYVFFRTATDDGQDPAGAAGVALPPGRAIAVDLARHPLGEPWWIDAAAPTLPGAFPAYRRLVMALDTGGAIKGDVRADLYIGRGDGAGEEAGRIRHTLRMYRLIPR